MREDMPPNLADFDLTFDSLAATRQRYDFAAASGASDERVWRASAHESAQKLANGPADWRAVGATRVLGSHACLLTEKAIR